MNIIFDGFDRLRDIPKSLEDSSKRRSDILAFDGKGNAHYGFSLKQVRQGKFAAYDFL